MRDKRPVDELSIEELERILAIRKREMRMKRLRRLDDNGRRVVLPEAQTPPAVPAAVRSESLAAREPASAATAQAAPVSTVNAQADVPRFEDELVLPATQAGYAPPIDARFRKRVWNRLLLLVEVVAFIGVAVIGVQMIQGLQNINTSLDTIEQESAALQALAAQPPASPTPEISLAQIVLPGGHTPPTSPEGARFAIEEIPAHLRPIVQQQISNPLPIAAPGPESPIHIRIPAIDVDHAIVSGTDWEALRRGVGHQPNTGLPGESGNVVLAAHNDIFGSIFRYLDQLVPGDEIVIFTQTQQYTYIVRETQRVAPNDVHVMDSTANPTTTLISCYPYQINSERIVVFADLANSRTSS